MEVSGQLHPPAALPPVPLVAERVWMILQKLTNQVVMGVTEASCFPLPHQGECRDSILKYNRTVSFFNLSRSPYIIIS